MTSSSIFITLTVCLLSTILSTANVESPESPYKLGSLNTSVNWFYPVNTFIDLILIDELPIDDIKILINGNLSIEYIKEISPKWLQTQIGLLILMGFGFLVVVILPFILLGCCCSCCCCPPKAASPKAHRNRRCLTSFVVLFLVVSLPGVIYLFTSSNFLNKIPDKLLKRVNDTFDDASTYIGSINSQLNFLLKDQLDSLKSKIEDELEIDQTLGSNIKNAIDSKLSVTKFFNDFNISLTDLKTANDRVQEIKSFWDPKFIDFVKSVRDFATKIKNHCNDPNSNCNEDLKQKSDELQRKASSPPNIDREVNKIKDVATNSQIQADLKKAHEKFSEIPEIVKNKAQSFVADMKTIIDDIDKQKNDFGKLTDKFNVAEDLVSNFRGNVTYQIKKHDRIINFVKKYTNYATTGISIYILGIWIIFCFGVFIAAICHQKTYFPEERNCGAHCGGLLLVTGVAIILLTGSILWLISTLLFPIGAYTQEYACKPLYDPEFKLIRNILKIVKLPQFLPNMSNDNVFDILEGCKNNEPAFKVLNLSNFVNLNEILKTEQFDNMEKEVNKLISQIDIPDLSNDVSSPEIENFLSESGQAFQATDNVLKQLKEPIDEEVNKLSEESVKLSTLKTQSEEMIKKVADIKNELKIARSNLENVDKLTLQARFQDMSTSLAEIKNSLSATTSSAVKDQCQTFGNNLKNQTEKSVNNIINYLKNKVAGCQPVWNIFDSSRGFMCKDLTEPLNGFWFALGWCLFFFLPLCCVACSLSKHFRRLEGYNGQSTMDSMEFLGRLEKHPY